MTLGDEVLKVRLFHPDWSLQAGGTAIRMPLGAPSEAHQRFAHGSGDAPQGFYAIVSQETDRITAAVDRIRSIPLFFGHAPDGGLRVSDSAKWVSEETGSREINVGARNDFLLAGYTTGDNTLISGVRQLQAGQRLDARIVDGKARIEVLDYFEFLRNYENVADDELLHEALDIALQKVMERTVSLAAGRQIVIPISGGNDSRIIATYMATMCPDQVMTFSYGRPSLGEVSIGRAVAKELGLRWLFVEGSDVFWKDLRSSSEVSAFLSSSHQLTSAPYMQDWPAVRELVRSGLIDPDSVIVPGHSGDVPTGGMIPRELVAGAHEVSVTAAIRSFHYSLWPYGMLDTTDEAIEAWIQKSSLPSHWAGRGDQLGLIAAADAWNWRERQAKWLVNSLRGVEAAGPTWWMPLWDAEFLDFWMGAPLQSLHQRRLYREFVRRKFRQVTNIDVPNYAHATTIPSRYLPVAKRLVPRRVKPFAQSLYRRVLPRSPGFGDMGWESWLDPRMRDALSSRAANITSFAGLETLLQIESMLPGLVPGEFKRHLED